MRATLDIEGNQREVIDAQGRVVMRYDFDMLGTRARSTSMEAGRTVDAQRRAGAAGAWSGKSESAHPHHVRRRSADHSTPG